MIRHLANKISPAKNSQFEPLRIVENHFDDSKDTFGHQIVIFRQTEFVQMGEQIKSHVIVGNSILESVLCY